MGTVLQEESVVLICQRAMALAEFDYQLDSLQDGSQVARQSIARYDFRRRGILERLDWAFARTRINGQSVPAAVAPPDLPSAWARPPRALRIRAVWSEGRTLRYRAEANLFTEEASAVQIVYTSEADNPALFPPIFTTALEYFLAADFSMLFARSINRQEVMLQLMQGALEEADQMEAFETPGGLAFGDDPWTDVMAEGF